MNREADKYFKENEPFAGLGRASLHSGLIVVAARCVGLASQLASMVVLGRLLNPHDFGLVALVFALIGFGPIIIDLGTTEASTQKAQITPGEVSTLFWLNFTIGGILTVLFAASSGLIAAFYGEPALADIARLSSLIFIMAAMSNQHCALMRRAMQFRSLAIIDITANVVSSVISIVMALTGWGYWALVAKPIVSAGLLLAGAWISCPWIPGRPQFTPEAKESVRFGLGVTGFTITDCFAKSADRLTLGYFYGAAPLGYFQNAFVLTQNLQGLVSETSHTIGVASLSKLRNNLNEYKRSWGSALSLVSFWSALAFATLAVSGQDFIVILLGPKWAAAGPLICIFAVRGIAQTIQQTSGWLHVSAGRSDRWMRWGVFSAVCQVLGLVAGLPFGLLAVAASSTIVYYVLCVPALAYAGRPVGIGAKDVLAAVGPQTVAGLCAVALGLLVRQLFLIDFSELSRFFVSIAICLVTYLAVALGMFRVTAPIQLALSVLVNFGPLRWRERP